MEERILQLLTWKKSYSFIVSKIKHEFNKDITEDFIRSIRNKTIIELCSNPPTEHTFKVVEQKTDFTKGESNVTVKSSKPLTREELEAELGIDNKTSTIKMVWLKSQSNGTWTYSVLVLYASKEQEVVNSFEDFLKTYKSPYSYIEKKKVENLKYNKAGLVFNKQDFHLNKKDEKYGDNSFKRRIEEYECHIDTVIDRAEQMTYLDEVYYIIGSDHFNSEITNATVKGTPQTNIGDYYLSFEIACNHEVSVINRFLRSSFEKINVVFLLGNHDACVSFHLVSWLKAYYKDESRVLIDIDPSFTKYFSVFDTAFCVNHGDVQKPQMLAQNFPLEYKREFAEANFHIILTGDKHKELSQDIGGIRFYQIPALSNAKSRWDMQNGYTTTKAESTTFLIEEGLGISMIFKNVII